MQVTVEGIDDLLTLASSQTAAIDKDTGKLVTNGAVNKQCCYCGIHASRESTEHSFLADLQANFSLRVGNGCDRVALGAGEHFEARGQLVHAVAVAHPYW